MKFTTASTASQTALPYVRILGLRVQADDERTILLPFVYGDRKHASEVMEYLQNLPDDRVLETWESVHHSFGERHGRFEDRLFANYKAATRVANMALVGRERQLLAGAYFTMEYAYQGAALFNPSIVTHPDQPAASEDSLRFVMSLRAVGEGHVSSVVFCTGTIDGKGAISIDPLGKYHAPAPPRPDRTYHRSTFQQKLLEMGADPGWAERLLGLAPEDFTLTHLDEAVARIRGDPSINELTAQAQQTFDSALWLARSNYQVQLPPEASIADLLIFPYSDNELHGIEDMRLVRFQDDGQFRYYGTYTAFDGARALPMLMDTPDFRTVSVHTLNGKCAQNKGMALFPRKIGGHYAMCSRIDGRNLFLMYSDLVHFWETATVLMTPKYAWEYRLMGNCGSALETKEGWLLITHGVGPMRQYCIGAALLDLDDPLKIRGRLKEPLIMPTDDSRAGYVPNVVYSCGGLIWKDHLYLPYGIADEHTAIAAIELEPLLHQILQDGP